MAEATMGDAIRVVTEEGGIEAASLMADLMEQNTRHTQSITDRVIEGLERRLAEETERADRAEARLEGVYYRVNRLVFGEGFDV